MVNFEHFGPTRILFGIGTESQVGRRLRKFGQKVLVVEYRDNPVRGTALYTNAIQSIKKERIHIVELAEVKPNPLVSVARKGIELCRREHIDSILAIGGGSVIDTAKTISIGVPYDGDVWDFFAGSYEPQREAALPLGVVVTLPAAGSEAGGAAVMVHDGDRVKGAGRSDAFFPEFAVLNPEFSFTVPPFQTACGVTDTTIHFLERYFTRQRGVELSDHLIEGAVESLLKSGPVALKEPTNYLARAEIMWASTLAQHRIYAEGRSYDFPVHAMEDIMGAHFDTPHAAGLAVLFPVWMEHVFRQDIPRFARFASRVFRVEHDFDAPEVTALQGIRRLRQFYTSLGMPQRLSELEFTENDIDFLLETTLQKYGEFRSNYVLTAEDMGEIYRKAL